MRLLIVEDEQKTGDYLKQGLSEAGFLVSLARTGLDGHHLAMTEEFDLLILDVMLPDVDGWRILQSLRESGQKTPVLFLSARDNVDDRVAFAEVMARVRTLLRRGQAPAIVDQLQIGDLILDIPRRRVTRQGKKVNLSHKEFCLLELLVRRQGEVLTRSLIASQVWDMNFDSDTNVIDVAIRRLRKKVDEGFDVKLIHTIRGMGYTLDLERNDD